MADKYLVGSETDALIIQECKLRGYSQKTIDSYQRLQQQTRRISWNIQAKRQRNERV